MEYKLTIRDGNPNKLEFKPDPVSSDGLYNLPLMEELIDEFKVPGWLYHKGSGILLLSIEGKTVDFAKEIQKAQEYITKLIDEAVRQQRINRILESLD